jgi:hypothetical protein
MNKSPWSAYGRTSQTPPADTRARDSTFGALANVERGREQLEKYLHGALRDYYEIRSGGRGYQKIIADALRPSPHPETVEEQLRRLANDAVRRRHNPPARR